MNITILAGGLSPERDVSLTSASMVANALEKMGHNVCLADVYEGVIGHNVTCLAELCKTPEQAMTLFRSDITYSYNVPKIPPSLDEIKARIGGRLTPIAPGIIELCSLSDVVYIGLHGAMGENGQLQATLDSYGIKYTGSGYIGSALAMDKDLSKRMISFDGVLTPPWVVRANRTDEELIAAAEAEIGYPCVVKPTDCGSSVGVSFANNREELASSIAEASRYGSNVIIEKKIIGRELSIGIVDGEPLPAVEIIPKKGFYDYKNKYQSGMTTELCPAPIPHEKNLELEASAIKVFNALRLECYARIDFILADDGGLYCLEANTLPGMTPASLLPLEARAIGMTYDELCDTIVRLACEKGQK